MAKRSSTGPRTPTSTTMSNPYPAAAGGPAGGKTLGSTRNNMEVSGAPGIFGRIKVESLRGGGGNGPTIAAGAAAGASPTVAVSGSDLCHTVSITTGTTALGSNGVLATVSFGKNKGGTPQGVFLSPANAAAAALAEASQIVALSADMAAGSYILKAGGTKLADSTAYIWHVLVIG